MEINELNASELGKPLRACQIKVNSTIYNGAKRVYRVIITKAILKDYDKVRLIKFTYRALYDGTFRCDPIS